MHERAKRCFSSWCGIIHSTDQALDKARRCSVRSETTPHSHACQRNLDAPTPLLDPGPSFAPAGWRLVVSARQDCPPSLPLTSHTAFSPSSSSSAALPARLSCVRSGFFPCPREGNGASAGTSLAGTQDPAGSTETCEHRGVCLPEPSLPVLPHQRGADPRRCERWLYRENGAHSALALPSVSDDV
jgi:hypothetical protein